MPKIGANFTLQGTSPNFDRDQFETVAAMAAYTTADEGHLTYCVETGKRYEFHAAYSDATTGHWKEYKTGATYQAGDGIEAIDNTQDSPTITVNLKTNGGLAVDEGGIYINFADDADVDALSFVDTVDYVAGQINVTKLVDTENSKTIITFAMDGEGKQILSTTEATQILTVTGYDVSGDAQTHAVNDEISIPANGYSATEEIAGTSITDIFVKLNGSYTISNDDEEIAVTIQS